MGRKKDEPMYDVPASVERIGEMTSEEKWNKVNEHRPTARAQSKGTCSSAELLQWDTGLSE